MPRDDGSRPATDDPFDRFAQLLALARATPAVVEPTSMTVASVDAQGRPSARIVLLKAVDRQGFVFYTNLDSRKGREIRARSAVALVFHWAALEWQVRVEGDARPVTPAEADAYFAGRPRGSQLGAWASAQSEAMESRQALEARLAEVTARYEGKDVPRPPHWSGFRVVPHAIEFWKGRPSRLHERDAYQRAGPDAPWRVRLLNP